MNSFERIHPAVSLLYFLSVLSVSMFLTNPVTALLSLSGASSFCIISKGCAGLKRDMLFFAVLFTLITVINPLFSHQGSTVLFLIWESAVTLESILYGASTAVMIISVMLWCKSFSTVMTGDKFMYLSGRLFPGLSLVLSMSLRYIPMLRRQTKKLIHTQKALGLYSSKSHSRRLTSSMRVFSALTGWSLENAVETEKSMRARGYVLKGRTSYSGCRFRSTDAIITTLCLVLISITASGILSGSIGFTFYPEIIMTELSFRAVCAYSAFALLAWLPSLIEAEEVLRWNYYRSKI